MTNQKTSLDNIILFRGTLDELNDALKAIGKKKQYDYAGLSYELYESDWSSSNNRKSVLKMDTRFKSKIHESGYDGVVRYNDQYFSPPTKIDVKYSGIPIKKIEDKNGRHE